MRSRDLSDFNTLKAQGCSSLSEGSRARGNLSAFPVRQNILAVTGD